MTASLSQANLITLLGLSRLPVEKRVAILERATDLVEAQLMQRILDILSESAQEQLALLMKSHKGEVVETFLAEKGIDILVLMEEEVTILKEQLVTSAYTDLESDYTQ